MTRKLAAATAVALTLVATTPATTFPGGSIETVAGTGLPGHSGDGGKATAATINHPRGLTILRDGSFLFAEPYNNTVRRVAADGTISTVAGNGTAGFAGDGGPATAAQLNFVHGVARMPDGGFVLADMFNNRIRRVWASGLITTVVGTGARAFGGDGGPATDAAIDFPRGIAALPDGELLIPDSGNQRVRRVGLDGMIRTVAGSGVRGSGGDGGPATSGQLNLPFGVAPLPDGGFLIAEQGGNRIRRVSALGMISTVAGTGAAGFAGDGGPATVATLNGPHAVVAVPDGGFLIADTLNSRVRRVSAAGIITTIAGTGTAGFGGDGGPATAAALDQPKALAVLPSNRGVLVADALNHRVRLLTIDFRPALVLRMERRSLTSSGAVRPAVPFFLSRPARISLTIRRGTSVVGRAGRAFGPGRSTVRLAKRLRPGVYALRLQATAADGRVASVPGSLRITP